MLQIRFKSDTKHYLASSVIEIIRPFLFNKPNRHIFMRSMIFE